jgi:hypothetical protein
MARTALIKTKKTLAQRLREGGFWLASLCCAALVVLLVAYSPIAAQGAREGLLICGQVIIPTLFPFFVLSGLFAALAQRKAAARLPAQRPPGRLQLMQRLFRQPAAAGGVLLIGLLGGYPMGAKATAQLFDRGLLTRRQAQCLLLYCVNAGPVFLIGVVGSALLGSRQAGLVAFAALSLASLLLALATRPLLAAVPQPPVGATQNSAQAAAKNSAKPANDSAERQAAPQVQVPVQALGATLNVCAWVVLFSCLCALLQLLPLAMHPAIPALNALLEVSSGVVQAIRAGMPLPVVCAVLGWAGVSVHCQILGDLRKIGLRLRWFWAARALHGALAAAICSQLLHWFPPDAAASLGLGSRTVHLWAISAPAAAALLLFCAFLILDLDLNRKMC